MDLYEALLARWPAPYTTLDIASRYGGAFVAACGSESALPVALIHGAVSNSAMWAGDVGEYSRHYRVYAVDLPGEPGKSAPVRLDWNSAAYAEWLGDSRAANGGPYLAQLLLSGTEEARSRRWTKVKRRKLPKLIPPGSKL